MADYHLQQLILTGKVEHKWSCLGNAVIYNLFPVGVTEEVEIKVSGLDDKARAYVQDNLYLAHALVSVAGYSFGEKFQEKLEFVRALQGPIRDLFVQEFYKAKLEQSKRIQEEQEKLKKHSPDQT